MMIYRKGGQAPHRPDGPSRKTVSLLAEFGIPQRDIARKLGICVNTLRKYYEAEIFAAKLEWKLRVAQKLYAHAMGDNERISLTACIFIMKCQAGWRDSAPLPVDGDRD